MGSAGLFTGESSCCICVLDVAVAPFSLAVEVGSSMPIRKRVMSFRSSKSSAGRNSLGNKTCSDSSCCFTDSGASLSEFAAVSCTGSEGSEFSNCVTKSRGVGGVELGIAGRRALA